MVPAMPRTARATVRGLCYHVINRGNARLEVFHEPEDYARPKWCLIHVSVISGSSHILQEGLNGVKS